MTKEDDSHRIIISKVRGILSHVRDDKKKIEFEFESVFKSSRTLSEIEKRFIFYPRIRKVGRAKDISRFSL